MKTITQTYSINAPIDKVWWALTSAEGGEQWGAGPAKFDMSEGGDFSYWGGDIHGVNTKVLDGKLLEQIGMAMITLRKSLKSYLNLNITRVQP